ncbi:MAG: phosphomethylpyrimidine synthase ThiC [Candidatus Omnitrophica bacterium]|nr:phosphomethylpyrimidine synthase ThiC [Candidatus Omnitrophota bacterium]
MENEKRYNQIEAARKGIITDEMVRVAQVEELDAHIVREGIAQGEIVIFENKKNVKDDKKICGVGKGLRTKVNANIGTSRDWINCDEELEKLQMAEEAGADAVMDLSTGGNLKEIRAKIINAAHIPVGTVPVYEVLHTFCEQGKGIDAIKEEDFLRAVEQHGEEGVDFVTVHCGLTLDAVMKIKNQGRRGGIVSRGGSFLAHWMVRQGKENPYYTYFDELLTIAKRFDLVLSLGDGLRPGALADATDRGQIQELIVLGELQKRAFEAGVQVVIEGPGHVPLDQIETNIILEKKLCNNAPFYVLGPLVTDIAPGYDHIVSAIGGALAARYGADFLCYVTPSEHLRLPTVDDVREGVIASRIAAHAADVVKLGNKARRWDDVFSSYRQKRDWKRQISLSIDPKKAQELYEGKKPSIDDTCTMCGEYCSYRLSEKTFQEMEKGEKTEV